jgi:hypothetical protein
METERDEIASEEVAVSIEAKTVESDNLSIAWATAMMRLLDKGVEELTPLTVTIRPDDDTPLEIPDIRNALDEELKKRKLFSCATTASTIFPQSLWRPGIDRTILYKRYKAILPLMRKHKANHHGMYFERMISYGKEEKNQLEHVISTYRDSGNHRRSALQLCILDPSQDHSNSRQRGFPCLQQVGFAHGEGGLIVSGYYPTQNIFDRAYGNYLGLYRLGQFVAHELDLKLVRVTCFSSVGKIGRANKSELANLAATLRVLTTPPKQPVLFSANGNHHDEQTSLQLAKSIAVGKR